MRQTMKVGTFKGTCNPNFKKMLKPLINVYCITCHNFILLLEVA